MRRLQMLPKYYLNPKNGKRHKKIAKVEKFCQIWSHYPQCNQIWRNFRHLGKLLSIYLVFDKILNQLWEKCFEF